MRDDLPEGETPVPEGIDSSRTGSVKKKEKLNVSMEKKGRGGKTATIIYGFTSDDEEIASVAAVLKRRLGIGGSSRGGEILLQGDVREKVKPVLREMGYGL